MKKRWWVVLVPGIIGLAFLILGWGILNLLEQSSLGPRLIEFNALEEALDLPNEEIEDIREVYLVGFFTDWRAEPSAQMREVRPDVWQIPWTFPPGETQYKFFLRTGDQLRERWVHDQGGDDLVDDSFGGFNSLIRVPDFGYWKDFFWNGGIFFLALALIALVSLPLGRLLSQARLNFKFKLYLPFFALWILGSTVFISMSLNQKKELIPEIILAQVNTVHRMIRADGIDLVNFEPRTDITRYMTQFNEGSISPTVGLIREEVGSQSNLQSFIMTLHLLDENLQYFYALDSQPNTFRSRLYFDEFGNKGDFISQGLLADFAPRTNSQGYPPSFYWIPRGEYAEYEFPDQGYEFAIWLLGTDMFLVPYTVDSVLEGYYFGVISPLVLAEIFLSDLLTQILAAFSLLLAISIVIFSLSNEMVLNLMSLIAWVKKISHGEFSSVKLLETHDEIQELASNVDRMRLTIRKSIQEVSDLNASYRRFLPKEFLESLGKKSVKEIQLGDQVQKDMSILFSDIRNFTTLSENLSPEVNFQLINSYLGYMEPALNSHGGFIDKYIGDGIMALFPRSTEDALEAAIAMRRALVTFNEDNPMDLPLPLESGIGINTGTLILGIVGGKERLDGTVISDAVNLASRLEDLTKEFKTGILISEQTYDALKSPEDYLIRSLDRIRVKGKQQPVLIYEVLDGETQEIMSVKSASIPGLQNMTQGSKLQAKQIRELERLCQNNPDDITLQRLLLFKKGLDFAEQY
jgi:class 3 adenylate cyclase/HAMP domain-containing protein